MPTPLIRTVADKLYWTYANLAMTDMASAKGETKYSVVHYSVRAKLFKGLHTGEMNLRGLIEDQKTRLKLERECIYCGSSENLSLDHIVSKKKGGPDHSDNSVLACRSCNSSKGAKDLWEWCTSKGTITPVLAARIYLKLAIQHFQAAGLMDSPWEEANRTPFDLSAIPTKPLTLIIKASTPT